MLKIGVRLMHEFRNLTGFGEKHMHLIYVLLTTAS